MTPMVVMVFQLGRLMALNRIGEKWLDRRILKQDKYRVGIKKIKKEEVD